jgi:hypothetical protein
MSQRADNGGGKATDLLPSFIQRAIQGVRYAVEGVTPSTFFGPLQPLTPQAQEAGGRQFDYPVGVNIHIQPRSTEGVSFAQLRALADNYDLLRIIIETRKDTLCSIKWKFQLTDQEKEGAKDDPRLAVLREFFKSPDKEHDFQAWYRMILEDLFVIDAPALYVRKTKGGITGPSVPYALEVIDGTTITRKINADGRTPLPPDVAYQQILKGIPAADFSRDELLYVPRNVRSNKIYGYSPVEQIIMTVNIALRRQIHQLEFYTEGNVPDLLMRAPDTWNPDQISKFQLFFDTLTDTGTRRKARFIPGGLEPYDTKQKELKDAFDEWLARVVCFCFSIAPAPFIKEMNRSTAETAAEAAKQEGLAPILNWSKSLFERIVFQVFGWSDIEVVWDSGKEMDPDILSQIEDRDLKNGSRAVNEVRASRGDKPVKGGDVPIIYGASPVRLEDAAAEPIDEPDPLPPVVSATPAAAPAIATEPPSKGIEERLVELTEEVNRLKKKALNRSTATGRLY